MMERVDNVGSVLMSEAFARKTKIWLDEWYESRNGLQRDYAMGAGRHRVKDEEWKGLVNTETPTF